MSRLLFPPLILFCLLLSPLPAGALVLDDFDRPDSPDPGPQWNLASGDCDIVGNRAWCSGLGSTLYVGAAAPTVFADLYHVAPNDGYAALVLGHADADNSLYIKLQSQNSVPGFESIGFFYGDNGFNNAAWSDSGLLLNALPDITAVHLVASLVGSDLVVSLDSDFDNVADYLYVRHDVPLALLGDGIGMGGWLTTTRIDNFGLVPASKVPAPTALALLAFGLWGLATLRRRTR